MKLVGLTMRTKYSIYVDAWQDLLGLWSKPPESYREIERERERERDNL